MDLHSSVPRITQQSGGYIDENLTEIISFVPPQLNGTQLFSNYQQNDLVLISQALCAPNSSILSETEKLYDQANQLNQYKASENSMGLHSSVPRITQQSGGYTDENLTEIMSFVPPQLDDTELFSSYQQNDFALINQALCAPNSSILSETEKLYDQANQLNQYKASENSMDLHSSVPQITQQSDGYTDENLTEIMSFVTPQLDDTELFSSYQKNDFAIINQALCAPNSSILSETEKLYDQANQLNQYKASENSMDLHSSVPQITQQSDRYTDENLTEIMSFVTPQLDDTELFSSYQQNDFDIINQALCAPNSSILSETEKLYDQANQLNQYEASENSMDLHSSVPQITQQSDRYTDENLTETMSFVPPQLDDTELFSSYQQNDFALINQALCAPNSFILSETEKLYDQANQLNQYKASENSMDLYSSVPQITQQSDRYADENLTEIMSFVTPQLNDTELFSSYQQNDFILINQALCAPNSSILSETEKLYDQANQLNQYEASENSMDCHSSVPRITQQSGGYTDEKLTEIMSFVPPQLDDTELFSSYQQNDSILINQALCAPNSSVLSETEKLYDQANQLNQDKASENDKTSNNPPTEDEEDSETVLPVGSSNIQSLTNGAGYLPENETINNPGSSKTEKKTYIPAISIWIP